MRPNPDNWPRPKLTHPVVPLKHERYNRQRRASRVTVCVAAICRGGRIVGAADRMLTSGDVEFEPQQPKIYQLTTSIAVMIAGDASIHSEIHRQLNLDIAQRIKIDSTSWISVKWVADLYTKYFLEFLSKRAELSILAPFGLTLESFLARQNDLSSDFVFRISEKLAAFSLPDSVEAIVTGVDTDGPQPADGKGVRNYTQLYEVYNERATSAYMTGFAAIGIGRNHANSQFMFSGYDRNWNLPNALLVTYSAKRRAEVSPGVGKATDMFLIGPSLGTYTKIGVHVIEELNQNYNQAQRNIERAAKKSEKRMEEFDKELARRQTTLNQANPQSTTADPSLQPPSPESPGGSDES